MRAIATAALLIAALPCLAADIDVDAIYQKWKAEESRTLQGYRVLDDDSLIGRLAPLVPRKKEDSGAFKGDHPKAAALLSVMHANGVGGAPVDPELALAYAASVDAKDLPEASYLRQRLYSHIYAQDGSLDIWLGWWIRLDRQKRKRVPGEDFVVADFPASAFLYGVGLIESLPGATGGQSSGAKDIEDGAARLKDAAEHGCMPAMVRLARLKTHSDVVPRDVQGALALWKGAAEKGYAPAYIGLGEFYDYRTGQRPDLEKCREYYLAAAELGSSAAVGRLASLPVVNLKTATVDDLYSRYVASWNDFEDGPTGGSGLMRLTVTGNSELAKHPRLVDWLRPRADPEDPSRFAEDELAKARTMYGECLLFGIGGAKVDETLGRAFLKLARSGGENPAASLLLHEQAMHQDFVVTVAADYLKEAVDAGFVPARRLRAQVCLRPLDYDYDFVFGDSDTWAAVKLSKDDALDELKELAKAGDRASACVLYEYFAAGRVDEWKPWLTKAAELGDASAALQLARLYDSGKFGQPDNAKSDAWYKVALKHPSTHAEAAQHFTDDACWQYAFECADLYKALKKSLEETADVHAFLSKNPYIAGTAQRGAKVGDAKSGVIYALCEWAGHGVTPRPDSAKSLLLSRSDDPIANFLVGRMMEEGVAGYKVDVRGATWIYEAVAQVGGVYAVHRLGVIKRAAKDDKKATGYFKKAAEGGCLPSMVELAKAYHDGVGIDADAGKAKEWARKAADAGDDAAKKLLEKWK